jgi:energy-coupling factor transport system ATP-binding protein
MMKKSDGKKSDGKKMAAKMTDSDLAESQSGMKRIVFEAEHLSFHYQKGKPILTDITLKIYEGEFTIIVGLNGSGKSTFASHLNGLLKPTSGKLLVFGQDTKDKKNAAAIHRQVGIVFQNPYLQFVGDTVEDDVAFGPENLGLDRLEIKKRVDAALFAVQLTSQADKDPAALSGGEAQAAAIAGVLAMDPACIILDEVTSMLDTFSESRVLKIIDALKERQKTVIYISHNPKDILKADRIIVFDQGSVSFDGTVSEYIYSDKYPLPDITKLMLALQKENIDVSGIVSNPDEAAKELLKLLK